MGSCLLGKIPGIKAINQTNLNIVADNPNMESVSYEVPIQLDAASMPFPFVILRANDGAVMYANVIMGALLGVKAEDLRGKKIKGLFDDDKKRAVVFKLLKQRTVLPAETIVLTDSANRNVKVSASTRLSRYKDSLCLIVALQDVPQGTPNLKKITSALKRNKTALAAAQIGIWSWNFASNNVVWDDTMHDLFGLDRGTFSGKEEDFFKLVHPEDLEAQYEARIKFLKQGGDFETKYRIVRPDGETRAIMMRGHADMNAMGKIVNIIGVCWDVSENYALTAKVEQQALFDPLTGLLNRFEMQRKLEELLESLKSEPSENTFCYFEIDRFKVVNDTFGHKTGDALLNGVAEHVRSFVKKADAFARMGGNEFAVIITNSNQSEARKVADRLHKAIEEFHFEWDGKIFDINASMALVPIDAGKTVNQILGSADVALSAAKDSGRNRIHEYRPHDSTMIRRQDEMQSVFELEDALRANRFQLNFQPIQPITDNIKEGLHYEVLLRVLDEDGSEMPPGELLKAAEQFDKATRVDKWVINAIFNWLKKNPQHCQELSLCSINLSGASIGDAGFLRFLQEKLHDADIAKEKISFEVTENAAIKNIKNAREFILKIKEFGCKFALDDFGSGLSSFAYLRDLPVDILKIDGMFVRNINTETVDYAMVKAINDVGKIMNMRTIAEYVENEEVYKKLKEIGVDYGQGYYFGKSEKLEQVIVVDSKIADSEA